MKHIVFLVVATIIATLAALNAAPHHVKVDSVVNKEVKTISIRVMKTRWGSCNPSRSYINLNLELIKKPKMAIEYVVFHELAHLIYLNHF